MASSLNCSHDCSSEPDVFKQHFKYYKSKREPQDLSQVLDFCDDQSRQKHEAEQVPVMSESDDADQEAKHLGLESPDKWKIYTLSKLPGLYFIANPFHVTGQQYWIKRCLLDYPKEPNKTNLNERIRDCWDCSTTDRPKDHARLFQMLRWATLGYHHNWDTKKYMEESYTPFPFDLERLTGFMARALSFKKFHAEAAIVNFYHSNSTLSGHVDHSEYDLTAPLFSISFGQSALFLLGGQSKSEKPAAMYLRSGDVVVMAGSARLAYHAVPKILQEACNPWLSLQDTTDNELKNILKYLQTSRININVRQVFPHD